MNTTNHYPMMTTARGTKSRCGQYVDRSTEANPAFPITCPSCLALLSQKAAAEFSTAAQLQPGQLRDFHADNGTMFARYATGNAA